MTTTWNPKERKKAFDAVYKSKILPFFEKAGYVSVTKTSKRVYKSLGNGLTVYLYIEFKNFGSGFYDLSIAYYDEELGSDEDGVYWVSPVIKKPKLKGNNEIELKENISEWLNIIDREVIQFINVHNNHKTILESDKFRYFSPIAEETSRALLARKSI